MRCKRLETKLSRDTLCDCIRYNEYVNEKELPLLHNKGRPYAFYERQINSLREKERELTEEIETHLEALEVAEDWHTRQKQELLDQVKHLEAENKRLEELTLTSQELLDEIGKLKERVKQLEEQNGQLTAKIDVKEPNK